MTKLMVTSVLCHCFNVTLNDTIVRDTGRFEKSEMVVAGKKGKDAQVQLLLCSDILGQGFYIG